MTPRPRRFADKRVKVCIRLALWHAQVLYIHTLTGIFSLILLTGLIPCRRTARTAEFRGHKSHWVPHLLTEFHFRN
jgi:hypothetical protein